MKVKDEKLHAMKISLSEFNIQLYKRFNLIIE